MLIDSTTHTHAPKLRSAQHSDIVFQVTPKHFDFQWRTFVLLSNYSKPSLQYKFLV